MIALHLIAALAGLLVGCVIVAWVAAHPLRFPELTRLQRSTDRRKLVAQVTVQSGLLPAQLCLINISLAVVNLLTGA